MIVSVHQPNYLPYLGLFHKMANSDILILYDTAQFSKNEFHNRNLIRTPKGVEWLTVPVSRSGLRPINEVSISYSIPWPKKHLGALEANYAQAPFYHTYEKDLAMTLSSRWDLLADMNIALIRKIAKWLMLDTRLIRSSELPPPSTRNPTEKLIHLVEVCGGTQYLSGPGGHAYLEETMFRTLRLAYDSYEPRPYRQRFGQFIPNLSVVDALMNCGEESRRLLE